MGISSLNKIAHMVLQENNCISSSVFNMRCQFSQKAALPVLIKFKSSVGAVGPNNIIMISVTIDGVWIGN
jgi:hypothetical protein